MSLERCASAWDQLGARLRANARVLVVDDEPSIRSLLAMVLGAQDVSVAEADSAESAWEQLQRERFDLLITDKNMPGAHGVELLRMVRDAELAVDSVLITGFPSLDSITRALELGSSDYVAKPFDDIDLVTARLLAVLDRRLSRFVQDAIVRDLASVRADLSTDESRELRSHLSAFRSSLAKRPGVLTFLDDESARRRLDMLVAASGESAVSAKTDKEALDLVSGANAPLASVVLIGASESQPAAVARIRRLRAANPDLPVLGVFPGRIPVHTALDAIAAGAQDVCVIPTEGPELLARRIGRLVDTSRQRIQYLSLVSALYQIAKKLSPAAAERVLRIARSADRPRIEAVAAGATAPAAPSPTPSAAPAEATSEPTSEAIAEATSEAIEDFGLDFEIVGDPNGGTPLHIRRK